MAFKQKLIISVTILSLLSVAILAGSLVGTPGKAQANADISSSDKRIVTVQGEGVVTVAPDMALISIGVETTEKDMAAAQEANSKKMNDVLAELEKLNIKKEDIQTQSYNVYPKYEWQNDKSVLVGYSVTNTVRVKIRKIDDTGKVLDAAVKKGANLVNNIQFTVSNAEILYRQALEAALKNAEEKAKVMVGFFGYSKLTAVNITENSIGYPEYIYDKGIIADEDAGRGTPISAGQLDIKASVNVSFEY